MVPFLPKIKSKSRLFVLIRKFYFSPIQPNQAFMRKIAPGCEAVNILIGELVHDSLDRETPPLVDKPVSVFIRLKHASLFPHCTEVPIPTRFFFVLLGPERYDFFCLFAKD